MFIQTYSPYALKHSLKNPPDLFLSVRSSQNIISSAVTCGCNIAMIIILACIEAKIKNLGKEMDDIEDTLPYSKDLKEEMLATFNDKELNKMLEISRQRDNEKKEQEKKELQEVIKDIKEKYHL